MAYSERLAGRIRRILASAGDMSEIKMFGGVCFTLGGHMCCGVVGDELVVRVGPTAYEAALGRPHARPMDFTGRPLRGMVFVGPAGWRSDPGLRAWIGRGARYVSSLPARRSKRASRSRSGRTPRREVRT